MKILAIDPGCAESAYVLMSPDYSPDPQLRGKLANDAVLQVVQDCGRACHERLTVAVEMVASYGMAVGREVFETCVWIGRFVQAAAEQGCKVDFVYRIEEKMALCHNSRARDANIRQALIDRFARFDRKSGKGTRKNPDVFYGFAADMWAAFAVGVTWLDREKECERNDNQR